MTKKGETHYFPSDQIHFTGSEKHLLFYTGATFSTFKVIAFPFWSGEQTILIYFPRSYTVKTKHPYQGMLNLFRVWN